MQLEVTVLTLPFDPLLEGFPNERVRGVLHGREMVSVEAFPFTHAGRPYWSLCLVHRRLQGLEEADAAAAAEAAGSRPAPSGSSRDAQRAAIRELLAELDERERVLYDRLRAWRRGTAEAEGKASYMVCANALLLELVRRRQREGNIRLAAGSGVGQVLPRLVGVVGNRHGEGRA